MNKYHPIALILLSSCTTFSESKFEINEAKIELVSVCEILSHPRQYVNRIVVVRGLYGMTPHQRILYDPTCSPGSIALRILSEGRNESQDKAMYRALKSKRGVGIKSVYIGKVTAEPLIVGCDKDSCYTYELIDSRLLSPEL